MIAESSLKYPVADFLTSLEMPLAHIQIEYLHPSFKKRHIDLVRIDRAKEKIENAFEFKIAQPTTRYESEQKRIFNDLMRLHLINKAHGSACYFFIAGKYADFMQCFRSISTKKPTDNIKDLTKSEGFYTEWFKFKANETQTFDVRNAPNGLYREIYEAFLIDYNSKGAINTLELPEKLTTTCIAISALSREFSTPYVGGIWKIE